jgi:hypothetical protein
VGCPHPIAILDPAQTPNPPRPSSLRLKGPALDAVRPRRTQGTTRSAQSRPRPPPRAGAFPADAAEALAIYGPILLSDAMLVSGQIPGIPSPALPGRASAPGRGPGFSQAGGCLGPESPRPQSRAPAVGGLRSPGPREPPPILPQQAGAWALPHPRPLRLI